MSNENCTGDVYPYKYNDIFNSESRFYFKSKIKWKVSQRGSFRIELVEVTSILKYQIYIMNVISAEKYNFILNQVNIVFICDLILK